MKKSLFLALILLFTFSITVFAKPNADDLAAIKQLSTQLVKEKTNYDPNSIRSLTSKTFTTDIKDAEGKTTTINVRAMFVEYAVLNDKLFYKTYKDVFYFDETNKVFLDSTLLGENKDATAFSEQYQDEIGNHVHYIGPLVILSLFILIAYLVLRYVDKNMYSSYKAKSA